MELRNIRMIAIDIDDTLLTSQGEVLPDVAAAVKHAQTAGIVVTLATGRTYPIAAPIAEPLAIATPLITNNGALVRSRHRVNHHWPIRRESSVAVGHVASRYGLTPLCFYGDGVFAGARNEHTDYYVSLGGLPPHYVGDLTEWISALPQVDGVSNMLLIGDEYRVAEAWPRLQTQFAHQLQISLSKPTLIEITAPGVSKWKALLALSSDLGIAPQHIMAIGDSLNDLEMLTQAGVGVAVANASERVRQAADLIVPSHDEGGVAVAIELCMKERFPA